ncbi:MAG TPA: FGGY-family carbohydrate kinase [Vicinamibacterales bacterium]|nr:FGGY-family carbohydrate kinase [Vicinamibacterales bacterium]
MSIYLGLDSSTQSVTATAIDVGDNHGRRSILFERSFRYDEALPGYGTRYGVLPSSDPRVVHAPPLMWSEALDRMIAELVRDADVDWTKLRAVSGSAQQHGSVYVNALARTRLGNLEPALPLADQIADVFSRSSSPIWMDSSTTKQCAAIEDAIGGARALARLTGSRAFERFTGPQIRKFAETDADGYASTDRVHLVSSWLASLLAGTHAPIDPGDGSGMNLMDLRTKQWAPDAVRATAAGLDAKLPPVAPSWTTVGTLSPYWTKRYNLPPAKVVAWSGDNPCSLVGTGLVTEGIVAVSLGTSDTIFGIMPTPRPSEDGTGHVFASPTGAYMGMTVFKNGSLARERVRDAYKMQWSDFAAALGRTTAGNGNRTMLPWFDPEITPLVLTPGVRRHDLDAADADGNVRAIIEAQMMALALHSRWMGVKIGKIYATGGASANRAILQVMADVFDAEVMQLETGNSAALGAALRAFHADRLADGRPLAWEDVITGFVAPKRDARFAPQPANVEIYRRLIDVYADRERAALDA